MSIFKRLKDLTLSNIYATIEKAEDPIKMTDQYLRNMQDDLKDAENAVAAQIALEKKYKQLYQEQEALFIKRDEQANQAAQAKKPELARRALEEKRAAALKRDEYKSFYDKNKLTADELRNKLEEMRKLFNELKNKRETLIARANTAKALHTVNKAISGIGQSTAIDDFKRMEDKIRHLEAEADNLTYFANKIIN